MSREPFPQAGETVAAVDRLEPGATDNIGRQAVDHRQGGAALVVVEPYPDGLVGGVLGRVDQRLLGRAGEGQVGVGR